ncbi:MAG: hypothetical protein ABR529_11165 [Actinomycetota bacterium]
MQAHGDPHRRELYYAAAQTLSEPARSELLKRLDRGYASDFEPPVRVLLQRCDEVDV